MFYIVFIVNNKDYYPDYLSDCLTKSEYQLLRINKPTHSNCKNYNNIKKL